MKINFNNMPFAQLTKESSELAEIRSDYSDKSEKEKRMAAEFAYDSAAAEEMVNTAFSHIYGELFENEPDWPGEVTALAMDPNFAPALLSVGSGEYLYGRIDEAMDHLSHLVSLPADTEDIIIIIEKAGEFLLDRKDYQNAIKFYLLACEYHPDQATLHGSLGYGFYKTKQFEKALEHANFAVKLEPDNHIHLSDLGWVLVEASKYDEAEIFLNRALKIAPDDHMAQGNLKELKRRRNKVVVS